MSCLLTQALTQDCQFILGGLSELYLANREQVVLSSITTSSITMSAGCVFYKITFTPNTGAFTNELTVSNNQKYVTQGVAFDYNANDGTTATIAPQLALGKFVAIGVNRAGTKFLLGRTGYGLQATVTSLSSGAAEGDFGGMKVSMTNGATEYAMVYSGSIPGN